MEKKKKDAIIVFFGYMMIGIAVILLLLGVIWIEAGGGGWLSILGVLMIPGCLGLIVGLSCIIGKRQPLPQRNPPIIYRVRMDSWEDVEQAINYYFDFFGIKVRGRREDGDIKCVYGGWISGGIQNQIVVIKVSDLSEQVIMDIVNESVTDLMERIYGGKINCVVILYTDQYIQEIDERQRKYYEGGDLSTAWILGEDHTLRICSHRGKRGKKVLWRDEKRVRKIFEPYIIEEIEEDQR